MDSHNKIDFIQQLDIQPGEAFSKVRVTRGNNAELSVEKEKMQSFFVEKSLVSFASTVSDQSRGDVLQTFLLAQMAANKQFPDHESIFDWYRIFLNTLTKVGWVIDEINEQNYEATKTGLEMDNVIIDILSVAFGQNYIAVVKKTFEAIKDMTSDDRKIKAFNKNTKTASQRGFQISLANEDNGVVGIQISTFVISSTLDLRRILFFSTDRVETDFQYLIKRATLNSSSYNDKIRKAVNDKIQHVQLTNISEIQI